MALILFEELVHVWRFWEWDRKGHSFWDRCLLRLSRRRSSCGCLEERKSLEGDNFVCQLLKEHAVL